MLYSMRDASKVIMIEEFIQGGISKEKSFRKSLETRGIIYKCSSRNKVYNNKWLFNWYVINNYYPEYADCFEDYYTDKGYYQPKITEVGLRKLRVLIYEDEK